MGQASCLQCGKAVKRKASQLAKYPKTFCNRRCKAEFQHLNPVASGIGPQNQSILKCETCGAEVTRTPATTRNRVFCSRKCASVTLIKPGKEHFMWKGGVTRYPPEYNKWLTTKIRRRDEFKCTQCGHPGTVDNRLEVHHKDLNRFNNAESNLQTLCVICHRNLHQALLRACSG